jgi:putative aldouronate transport system permease protein
MAQHTAGNPTTIQPTSYRVRRRPGTRPQILLYGALSLLAILCLIPMLVVVSTSFSSEDDVREHGYPVIVRDFSLQAYRTLIGTSSRTVMSAYSHTVSVSAVGTVLSLLACSMTAYVLARRSFFLRKQLTFFIFFTMLFNGGLVPTYIVITQIYRLQDTFWVLVLPLVVVPWYIIILRTFMQGISFELIESAKIDGASEFRIYLTIIMPLAKPGLACIGLFILLRYWNSWFEAMLYINRSEWVTLQLMLIRMQQRMEAMFDETAMVQSSLRIMDIPSETLRMAMVVVAAGPMLVIFPFFQKYFVRGLTIGSVKG